MFQYTIGVEGMACGMCEAHINQAVRNALASIIRADGSPRYAMGAMLVGAVINIIGDPVAIFVLNMGIKGAAYATILGQFVSFLLCAAYLAKSKTFRISAGSFRLDFALLRHIMAWGHPAFCPSFPSL